MVTIQMLARSFDFLVESEPSLSNQLKVSVQLSNAHFSVMPQNSWGEHSLQSTCVPGEFVPVLGTAEQGFDSVQVPTAKPHYSKCL